MTYNVGDRVRVRRTHPWAHGAIGTVTMPYDQDMTHILDPQPYRTLETTGGPVRLYSIVLDEPVDDGDGGGPYEGIEVREDQCRPLPVSRP